MFFFSLVDVFLLLLLLLLLLMLHGGGGGNHWLPMLSSHGLECVNERERKSYLKNFISFKIQMKWKFNVWEKKRTRMLRHFSFFLILLSSTFLFVCVCQWLTHLMCVWTGRFYFNIVLDNFVKKKSAKPVCTLSIYMHFLNLIHTSDQKKMLCDAVNQSINIYKLSITKFDDKNTFNYEWNWIYWYVDGKFFFLSILAMMMMMIHEHTTTMVTKKEKRKKHTHTHWD